MGSKACCLVSCCPYDGLPCGRFSDDLGVGICEIEFVDDLGFRRFASCIRLKVEVCNVER